MSKATPEFPSGSGLTLATEPIVAPRLVIGSPGARLSVLLSSVLKRTGAHALTHRATIAANVPGSASPFAPSRVKGLNKCWHHLAREQINTLIRIHVTEDDGKERYALVHAPAHLLDDLRRGAFDPGGPERQALGKLPFFLDFGVTRADTDQELLRDINLIDIAAGRLAVLFEHV